VRAWLTLLLTLSVGVLTGRALVIAGSDGTQNTTNPGGGLPWDHVGSIGGASGVYLGAFGGGYWVATATHVGAGDFTLGSTTYSVASGSAVQVSGSDLTLFRLSSDPGLANLTLATTAPTAGSTITMVGRGVGNNSSLTTWFVDTTPPTPVWSTSNFAGADGTASGYAWAGAATMRWGSNTIETGQPIFNSYNIGTGATNSFVADFDAVSGQTQGAVGDSGGAAFYFNGSTWELAGIMGAIGTFSGQPGSTAVFGNVTYLIDLASYNGAIVSAIPEPAEIGCVIGGLAAGAAVWARRRRLR
jgi:hypothetical protein